MTLAQAKVIWFFGKRFENKKTECERYHVLVQLI